MSSPKKNVLGMYLFTGAAGYIGSHVALCCLLSRKYRVVTIDNFHNSSPKAADAISKLALEALPADATDQDKADTKVQVVKGDLSDRKSIEAVFEQFKQKDDPIWGVIHIAAHKAVGESGEKPLQYYNNNVIATINLLDVMNNYNANHFVYSSSATVYGAPETIPIPESTPLDPQSCYGRTKAMTENIIKDLCDSQPDSWKAISLRYFNPGGAHPSGDLGESPLGRPGNLLPLLAAIAVGRYPNDLKVFGNDYPTRDGCCVRDYIHIMDLAQGHLVALDALDKSETFVEKEGAQKSSFGGSGGKYRAFNLGTGKGSSVLEIIEAMRKATGFDYKYTIEGRRTGDVPDLTADPKLAEQVLGFKATQSLETMCNDLWNWQTKNPKGFD